VNRIHSKRRAVALPLVILAILTLAIIGMAFLDLTRTRFALSYKAVHYNRAYYLAEAGLQWSAYDLDAGRSGVVDPSALPDALRDLVTAYPFRLGVTVAWEGHVAHLASRATVGGMTVVLEADRDLGPLAAFGGKP